MNDNTTEWITVECSVCGDEFVTMRLLADLPKPTKCTDCRSPFGRLSPGGAYRPDGPHMEYGPLSL